MSTQERGLPGQPRTMTADETAALNRVRRRITALIFLAVALHGVLGLAVVAEIVDSQGRHDKAIGLLVMSGIVGLITCAVTRLILEVRIWSPLWFPIALVPAIAGFIWIS